MRIGSRRSTESLLKPSHLTIGHSTAAHQSGTTALYTGSLTEDGWSKRVKENFEEDFSVDVTDTPFKKRRKLNVGEIEKRCEIDGLESSK